MGYTTQQFIDKIKPYAIEDMRKNKILASLTIAQGILESNNGNSGLTTSANNLFGIKGKYNGQSVKMWTTEYYDGVKTRVQADFRKYPSWLESIYDHSDFLRKYKRYASIIGDNNYRSVAEKIGKSGYATDKDYGNKILNLMVKYKLYEIDNEALGMPSIAPTAPTTTIKYKVGVTYKTTANLYVRCDANGEKKLLSELSANAKKNAYDDGTGHGILRKGTQVTCKAIKEVGNQTWMQIPSGWICAIDNKQIYIE